MTSGSHSLSTIPESFGTDSKIKGFKHNSSKSSSSHRNTESPIWKDLGNYLETVQQYPRENPNFKNDLPHIKTPITDKVSYRVCALCERPILTSYIATHIKTCLEEQKQREKERLKNMPPVKETAASLKKRKAESRDQTPSESDGKPTKKKTKKEKAAAAAAAAAATKTLPPSMVAQAPDSASSGSTSTTTTTKTKKNSQPKHKGPVDVEKQCGVALENGGFCARSLTCKTHSMGAKRAVPGRSASYDALLSAYQHKNQVKSAGQAAKAQAEKDEAIHGSQATLNSDEETQEVLTGVTRSLPLPLERNVLLSSHSRTKYFRMREMFASAIMPRVINNNGGGIYGRSAMLDVERSNEHLFPVKVPQRPPNMAALNKQGVNAATAQSKNTPRMDMQNNTPVKPTSAAAAAVSLNVPSASPASSIPANNFGIPVSSNTTSVGLNNIPIPNSSQQMQQNSAQVQADNQRRQAQYQLQQQQQQKKMLQQQQQMQMQQQLQAQSQSQSQQQQQQQQQQMSNNLRQQQMQQQQQLAKQRAMNQFFNSMNPAQQEQYRKLPQQQQHEYFAHWVKQQRLQAQKAQAQAQAQARAQVQAQAQLAAAGVNNNNVQINPIQGQTLQQMVAPGKVIPEGLNPATAAMLLRQQQQIKQAAQQKLQAEAAAAQLQLQQQQQQQQQRSGNGF